jgi:uncharacterized protein
MTLALLTVLLSVFAGAGLAFLGGRDRRHLARIVDSFSLVACIVVVLVHLLPHAISRVGFIGLLPFAAALLVPLYFERWAHHRAGDHGGHGRAALEIGYAGLLLHQIGDGLGLGTFASGAHEGHDHMELALAIFAHTVPVAAVVTIAFIRATGPASALLRAVGLAVAGVAGVGLAGGTPNSFLAAAEPWVTSVVAGLLLHVITHDFRPEGGRGTSARVAELVAVALGVGLIFIGEGEHAHGDTESFRGELERALVTFARWIAPATLVGLFLASIARAVRLPMPSAFFEGLDRTDESKAPELFFVTLALTVQLFGWLFAVLLATTALLLAIVGARMVGLAPLTRRAAAEARSFGAALALSFDVLLTRFAPWIVLGLVAATYASAGLRADSLFGMGALGVAIAGFLAFPIHLSGAGGVALLFVAVGKGLSPGAALAALVIGPATSVVPSEVAHPSAWRRVRRFANWGVWISAIAIGVFLDVPILRLGLELPGGAPRWPANVELGSLVVLATMTLWILVRDGVRAFIGTLGDSLGALPHSHEGDAHAHDHE